MHLNVRNPSGNAKFIRLQPAMPLPSDPEFQNDMDPFMYTRTLAASSVVMDEFSCTAVYSPLGNSQVNWAVKEMCGCSALIVVSERAMYFTHYFEDLAFCGTRAKPSNFKREVLDALDNGTTHQESLAAHSAEFQRQPGLAAFIITPTTTSSPALLYKAKIDQLKNKVNSIIGIIPDVISYVPEDYEASTVLGTNALGTALFQYDPNHQATNPKKLAKVWVERRDAYTHTNALAPSTYLDIPPPYLTIPPQYLTLPIPNPAMATPATKPNNIGLD